MSAKIATLMKLADLHIHSRHGIETYTSRFPLWNLNRITIRAIFKKAKDRGLSAIAISDHDNIEASFLAQKIASEFNILIIPAAEITSKEGHILAYGIKENIQPLLSAKETIEKIHKQNGLAVAAHPFFHQGINAFYQPKRRKQVKFLNLDGLEVISCVTGPNQKAKKTAKVLGLAQIGGSDAHCLAAIGYGLTVFPDSCQSVEDYLQAIKNRKTFGTKGKGLKFGIWLSTLFDSRLRYYFGI